MTFLTHSEEETIELGRRLARDVLPPRGVVLLVGNLGAGKTTLAKGIAAARGAAMPGEVSSPTYTLIHEYGSPVGVYHIDLYRLDTPQQAAALGLDEIVDQNALVLVEWGERFPELFPPGTIRVELERTPSDERRISVLA